MCGVLVTVLWPISTSQFFGKYCTSENRCEGTGDVEESVLVAFSEVAGSQQQVRAERLDRLRLVVQVAHHHVPTVYQHLH